MTKERKEILESEEQIEIIKKNDEKLEAFIEDDSTPVESFTKKRKSNVSVAVEKFDWDAYEKEYVYDTQKEVIEDMYSQTLSEKSWKSVLVAVDIFLGRNKTFFHSGSPKYILCWA